MKIEGFPWDFHPESVEVVKFLAANRSPIPRDQLPIDVLRKGHFRISQTLSTLDQKYDVTRTEEFVPSDDVTGVFQHRTGDEF